MSSKITVVFDTESPFDGDKEAELVLEQAINLILERGLPAPVRSISVINTKGRAIWRWSIEVTS